MVYLEMVLWVICLSFWLVTTSGYRTDAPCGTAPLCASANTTYGHVGSCFSNLREFVTYYDLYAEKCHPSKMSKKCCNLFWVGAIYYPPAVPLWSVFWWSYWDQNWSTNITTRRWIAATVGGWFHRYCMFFFIQEKLGKWWEVVCFDLKL